MNKYEMVKLGEVATYINGYAFKPTDWSNQGLPIIRIQDLTGNSYKTNKFNGAYDKKYEINSGDILISWSASLGVYVWSGEKSVLNQHIFKVVFNKCKIDKSFFVYQVKSILSKSENKAHGATMKHLTKSAFDNLPFILPPLEEQKKIANVLDKVSDLIEKRKTQIEQLDILVKSKFIEMFGDPVTNPMGWEKDKLSNIVTKDCTVSYGIVQLGEENKNCVVPVIRPVDIVSGKIKLNNLKKTTLDISNRYKKTILQGGELLITVRANIGDTYLIDKEFEGCNVSRGVVPIRVIKEMINVVFLREQIENNHMNDYIRKLAKGITLIQLNIEDLRNIEIVIPKIDLQNKFAKFVEKTEQIKKECEKGLDELETLKKALMQKYFE